MSLNDITTQLGEHYRSWKAEEKEKDKLRKEFFNEATKAQKTLARKTIRVDAASKDEACQRATELHAKWRIVAVTPFLDRTWHVHLEEDPAYKVFEHVNPEDGFVYRRQIEQPILVETERLREEDPEFWEEVSFVPDRQLKPIEELTEAQQVKLQQYVYYGKPIVKLPAPRRARPEDYEDAQGA